MTGARRTARPLWQARSPVERDGGYRMPDGCGGTHAAALARAGHFPVQRQRAGLPPHKRQVPLRDPTPGSPGTSRSPVPPLGESALCSDAGWGRTARRAVAHC